ncbi:hypothetical protein HYX16_04920 [Candidatus Woesearchaeota archaeon]|nr:hypothetical protein [Candidatus Woesearchaeota archaeon]
MVNPPNTQRPRKEQYADVVRQMNDNTDVLDNIAEFDWFRKEQLKAQLNKVKEGRKVNPFEANELEKQYLQALGQPLGAYISLETYPNLNVPQEEMLPTRVRLGLKSLESALGHLE